MTLRAQRELCDENVLASFQAVRRYVGDPRGATRQFAGATAIVSGLDSPFYNPIFVLAPVTPADVGTALDWVVAQGARPSIHVREELDDPVAAVAADRGLIADPWHTPGMVLSIPAVVPGPPPGLEVRVVEDDTDLDAWHQAAISGPNIRRFVTRTSMREPDLRLVVGYVNGQPVTGGAALRTPGVVGVYAIGTIEAARRRGYGRAITWAAIDAGRKAWQADTAILQASELGEPVYRSMGFVEVSRYVAYMPETPA